MKKSIVIAAVVGALVGIIGKAGVDSSRQETAAAGKAAAEGCCGPGAEPGAGMNPDGGCSPQDC